MLRYLYYVGILICSVCFVNVHYKCAEKETKCSEILFTDKRFSLSPETEYYSIEAESNDVHSSLTQSTSVPVFSAIALSNYSKTEISELRLKLLSESLSSQITQPFPSQSLPISQPSSRSLDFPQSSKPSTLSHTAALSLPALNSNAHSSLLRRIRHDDDGEGQPYPDLFQEFFKSSVEASTELSNTKPTPPLNLFTTLPKNFSGFLAKIGPAAVLQDKVEGILMWKNPSGKNRLDFSHRIVETLLALTIFILLCLHPSSLLFVPHVLVLTLLGHFYYIKLHENFTDSCATSTSNAAQSSTKRIQSKNPRSSVTPKHGGRRHTPVDYLNNMKFIQNSMGMYCDLVASTRSLESFLNWSDHAQSTFIFKWTLASALMLFFGHCLIPWRLLALSIGLFCFGVNTAFGRALQFLCGRYWRLWQHSAPLLPNFYSTHLRKLWLGIGGGGGGGGGVVDSVMENGDATNIVASVPLMVLVECVENQRWWSGLQWYVASGGTGG